MVDFFGVFFIVGGDRSENLVFKVFPPYFYFAVAQGNLAAFNHYNFI